MKIRVLPDNVVNAIAAGEVVERPASVVRELCDNSLDSGASFIEIILEQGGRTLIRVIDDGCGMDQDDALLSLERHATSKIKTADDLSKLVTRGFRGEALAAISSVCRMEILTRTSSAQLGTLVSMDGGILRGVKEVASPPGTTVSVKNLFFNTPVRRRFLRAPAVEEQRVLAWLIRFAMGAPDIRIRFVSDNRELLSLPAQQNFLERAGSLMQGEVKEVKFEDEDVAVQGLVGHPSLASATGEPCIFLVNGRPVSDRAILRAVREGFQNTLKEREIPVCTLSIDLEPHLVDVNVHPQKSEVRFVAPHNIWRVVREGVSRAVNGFGLTANKLFPSNHYNSDIFFQKYRPLGEITINSPERCYDTSSDLHEIRPNDQKISGDDTGRDIGDIAKYLRDSSGSVIDGDDYFSESSISDRLNHPMNSGPSFSQLRYIGQLLRCYLVCEYQSNLFVIDMHAAHERINYNKIRAALRGRPLVTQQLLLPEPIKVGSLGVRRLLEHQSVLDSLGIELEPFGPEEVIVRAIPPFLKPNQLQLALNDIINYSSFDDDRDVSSDAVLAIVEKEIDRLAARMACHASIRGGDEISREQAVALLESLDDEVLSGACPHGRPIVVSFKESEIEKWFGRDR